MYRTWKARIKVRHGKLPGAENLILQVLQFQKMDFCHKFPGRASLSHYRSNQGFVESQFNVSV
jgi:hypothetical protein